MHQHAARKQRIGYAFLLFVTFALVACEPSDQHAFEDQLYQCYRQHLTAKGIDLKDTWIALEKQLIADQWISDGSGPSYRTLFKRITVNKDVDVKRFTQDLKDRIERMKKIQGSPECDSLLMDSVALNKSSIGKLKALSDSLERTTPAQERGEAMSAGVANVLSDADFAHPYFKLFVLNYLVYVYRVHEMSEQPAAIERKMKAPEASNARSYKDSLIVLVSAEDDIYANGKLVNSLELYELAKADISKSLKTSTIKDTFALSGVQPVTDHILVLRNEEGTGYGRYAEVQKILARAYSEVRDAHSLLVFQHVFDALTDEQKAEIRTMIPQRVSDSLNR